MNITKDSLKQLSRSELLSLLLEQTKHAYALQEEVDDLRARLESREIHALNGMGTLADSLLEANGFFEAVDKAAESYLRNIRQAEEKKDEIISDASARANEMLRKTYQYCEALIRETERTGRMPSREMYPSVVVPPSAAPDVFAGAKAANTYTKTYTNAGNAGSGGTAEVRADSLEAFTL